MPRVITTFPDETVKDLLEMKDMKSLQSMLTKPFLVNAYLWVRACQGVSEASAREGLPKEHEVSCSASRT